MSEPDVRPLPATRARPPAVARWGHDVASLCPRCLKSIPGRVVSSGRGVVMRKTCPEHGDFECIVATDVAAYERMRHAPRFVERPARTSTVEAKGCPDDCGLCPAHDQHTCLAIVELTTRCNLPCPVCLADARAQGADLSAEEVLEALRRLLETEGQPVPLQFAGGEPALHPQLVQIVGGARALGYTKMEIDSNGLRLAQDPRLAVELRRAGLTGVYLQFDGLGAGQHAFMRGRDLRAEKLRAIAHCRDAGLQVVLAVTVVPGVNDADLWTLVRFAVEQRLTGINFQPVVLSGRYPRVVQENRGRVTATHFLRAIESQSEGKLRAGDFMPMACPDPRCGLLSYLLVGRDGALLPLVRLVGDARLRQHVAAFSDWESLLRQLGCAAGCSCADGDPRAALAGAVEGAEFFSVGFHGMMDAECFDRDRARRCCVHKLTADGRLMPFCLYNIRYRRPSGMPHASAG